MRPVYIYEGIDFYYEDMASLAKFTSLEWYKTGVFKKKYITEEDLHIVEEHLESTLNTRLEFNKGVVQN